MSALSDEFVALAQELLKEEGVAVSVTRRQVAPMTASGDRAMPNPPSVALGIIFPNKGTIKFENADRASERVVMTPVEPWPVPGDRITINGRALLVGDDGAKTYAPTGQAIIHDLSCVSA